MPTVTPLTWIQFLINGYPVAAYSFLGTFKGELEATKEQLAYTHNVSSDDIEVRIKTGDRLSALA